MKTQHTPTPWRKDSLFPIILDNKGNEIADVRLSESASDEQNEANAAHIVKCVNLHDELVQAIGYLQAKMTNRGHDWLMCEDLLKRAKGGE